MATLARAIPSDGLVMQFSFYDSKKQEYAKNIQLCGHDNYDFKDGKTDKHDTTDFCQAGKGTKSFISGAKDNGTLSINLKRFDPRQPALAAYMYALVDSLLKVRVMYCNPDEAATDVDVCTFFCQKAVNPNWNSKVGEILSGSIELSTVADAVWTIEDYTPETPDIPETPETPETRENPSKSQKTK